MRHLPFVGLGLGLLIAATPALAGHRAWSGDAPRVWDQAWDVTSHPDVHVLADDAHLRFHAGPAGKVTAHLVFELKHWGLVIGMSEPTVTFERRGDQIWITARDPKGLGVIGGIYENFTVDV